MQQLYLQQIGRGLSTLLILLPSFKSSACKLLKKIVGLEILPTHCQAEMLLLEIEVSLPVLQL